MTLEQTITKESLNDEINRLVALRNQFEGAKKSEIELQITQLKLLRNKLITSSHSNFLGSLHDRLSNAANQFEKKYKERKDID